MTSPPLTKEEIAALDDEIGMMVTVDGPSEDGKDFSLLCVQRLRATLDAHEAQIAGRTTPSSPPHHGRRRRGEG